MTREYGGRFRQRLVDFTAFRAILQVLHFAHFNYNYFKTDHVINMGYFDSGIVIPITVQRSVPVSCQVKWAGVPERRIGTPA